MQTSLVIARQWQRTESSTGFNACNPLKLWLNKAMRLTTSQVEMIRSTAHLLLGGHARVILFGSRVHDDARGGDVDLLVETPEAIEKPAVMSARMASRISRAMNGRKVDVVLKAPNLLAQPIHEIALATGVAL